MIVCYIFFKSGLKNHIIVCMYRTHVSTRRLMALQIVPASAFMALADPVHIDITVPDRMNTDLPDPVKRVERKVGRNVSGEYCMEKRQHGCSDNTGNHIPARQPQRMRRGQDQNPNFLPFTGQNT